MIGQYLDIQLITNHIEHILHYVLIIKSIFDSLRHKVTMEKLEKTLEAVANKVMKTFFPKIMDITPQQLEILKSIFICKKDTFAILPTGHGKSLPYQIAPAVALELGLKEGFKFFCGREIVIVISPLLAIMDLQTKLLQSVGIRACCLHEDNLQEDDLQRFSFSLFSLLSPSPPQLSLFFNFNFCGSGTQGTPR